MSRENSSIWKSISVDVTGQPSELTKIHEGIRIVPGWLGMGLYWRGKIEVLKIYSSDIMLQLKSHANVVAINGERTSNTGEALARKELEYFEKSGRDEIKSKLSAFFQPTHMTASEFRDLRFDLPVVHSIKKN